MRPLDSESLIAIQKLIVEPLTKEVGGKLDAAHAQVTRDMKSIVARLEAHDAALTAVRADVGRLQAFKRRVGAVYAIVALALGTAWGLLVEWVKGQFLAAKP